MNWVLLWLRTLFSFKTPTLQHVDDESLQRARQIRRDQEYRLRLIESESELFEHRPHGGTV